MSDKKKIPSASALSYLQKWAYLPSNTWEDVKEKCLHVADAQNYLIHLFMYSIFYTMIDGNGSSLSDNHPDGLPDLDSNVGENAPENWLEAYKSPYLKEIEHKGKCGVTKRYVVMNTGLFNDRYQELYLLFKENSLKKQPWLLAGIYTYQENILVYYREELPQKVNFLTDIDFIVFDKTKLSGWNNSRELACDLEHIIKQGSRLEQILSDVKDKDKRMEEFSESVTKSCIKTSFNYKFAVPYIYFDTTSFQLIRSFLLPLSFGEDKKYNLFAAVRIKKNKDKNISYSIHTLLDFDMAKKDAEIVCSTEENWLCQEKCS